MGKNESDGPAIERSIRELLALGCPNARVGQGGPEFDPKAQRKTTPDILIGPSYGQDDPRNFYVDVQRPKGDYFIKADPKRPELTQSPRELFDECRRTGVMRYPDLSIGYVRQYLLSNLETKIERYVLRRQSPLYGHVFYFDDTIASPLQLQLAADDCLIMLASMVDYDSKTRRPGRSLLKNLRTMAQILDSPGTFVRNVEREELFAFLLYIRVFSESAAKVVLIRNQRIIRVPSLQGYATIQWLRTVRP